MTVRVRAYTVVGNAKYANGKPKREKRYDVIWQGTKASTHTTKAAADSAARVLREKDKRLAAAKRRKRR